jgi:transcriptional regulator with XRE-family HTH domain
MAAILEKSVRESDSVARKLELIGDALKTAATESLDSGWSVRAIAREAGVSQSTIHAWINDGADIRLSTASAIAAWLEMELTRPRIPDPDPDRKPGRPSK